MDVSQIKPTKGKILVEIELLPERTKSGIYRPPSARNQRTPNKTAIVVAAHEDFTKDTGVENGDRVILNNFVNETPPIRHKPRLMLMSTHNVLLRLGG